MGKSGKGKERKAEKKMMNARMDAGWLNVKRANAQADPLEVLPSFRKLNKGGVSLAFETCRAADLNQETKDWMFKLLRDNMKAMYQKAEWGWNEANKKTELFEDVAWYLIARQEDGTPVAFAHFRFDMDFDDDVLYCYEIQLEESLRRKGIGKVMMKVLELIMNKNELVKIMLTVFKHNEAATDFFKKCLKYDIDETCPYNTVYEQFDYEILSRYNPRRKPVENVENHAVAANRGGGGCCSGC